MRLCEENLGDISSCHELCLIDLPTAVLHDILFRLPTKSILHVKLVCRDLYKLVCDTDFAVNYSKNSSFLTLLTPPLHSLCSGNFNAHAKFELLEFGDNYESCIRTSFKSQIPEGSKFDLEGTCNGIICLSERKILTDVVYICNPIMGEFVHLQERTLKHGEVAIYGFGFCTSTKKFKVLRTVYNTPGNWYPFITVCEIFTIGIDDAWRVLTNQTNGFTCISTNDCLAHNGALYWIVNDNVSNRISTFHLGEEKLGRLSHPHGLVLNSFHMKLVSTNNQLCLLDNTNPAMIVIWKMKDKPVAESWIKDVICDDTSFIPDLRDGCLFPVTILENGDILFSTQYGNCLVCNPRKRKSTRIQAFSRGTITYTPSFLSLKESRIGHQSTINA